MTIKIKHKRGTASAVASANPTPAAGELVFETDTRRFKLGDGSTAYTSLAYVAPNAGDITSGTLDIARIANDAVTYAKLQNVSATDRLLGRSSAGAGDVEEITCTSFGRSLIDDADAAAARTTLSVQPTASPAFTGTATFGGGQAVPVRITNDGAGSDVYARITNSDTGTTAGLLLGLNANEEGVIRVEVNKPLYIDTNNQTRLTISSTGTATFAGQILADDIDSANSVAYGFDSDPDTGIGRRGANILTAVTGGVERLRVSSSGNVTIGEANSANARLMVAGGSSNISSARATYEGTLQINESSLTTLESTGGIEFKTSVFGSGYGVKILGADDGSLIVGNRANSATWSESFRVNQNREMLIGTTTDNGAYLLQVNSQIYATNATIATSDARFKTHVESLTDATSVIESLRPVAFDFIPQTDRNFATERQVGLIAQEAQAALAGTDYADSVVAQCGDHLGLAYEKLVPVLIKALQESNARIAALEERLNHA
jgi:hypothetical protein